MRSLRQVDYINITKTGERGNFGGCRANNLEIMAGNNEPDRIA